MAKKDPSLSLDYILKKQETEKLSGLSSTVATQLQAAGATTSSPSPQTEDTSMLSELKSINNNITKMARAILDNSSLLKTLVKSRPGPQNVPGIITKAKDSTPNYNVTESQLEQEQFQDEELDVLGKIEKNTRVSPDKVQKTPTNVFGGLGGFASALALAIGGLIGVISAQVKLLRNFLKFVKDLLPENLLKGVKDGFVRIGEFFSELFSKITKVFSIEEDSMIGKIFGGIKKGLQLIIKPFQVAFETIGDLVMGSEKVGGFFTKIADWFGIFAKSIGKVAIIAEKIAYPIMIVMAVWDTVKGFIEGFKKDGIIGGIKGAITGLLDSLVGGLLDMIKGAISWVAGFLGFKNVEKWLDSFSFEDMIHNFVDMMFKPVEMIRDLFKNMWDWLQKLEIPGIGFSAFGRKFEFGPWHPFKSDKKDVEAPAQSTKAETVTPEKTQSEQPKGIETKEIAPQIAPPVPQAAEAVYNKSSENATISQQPVSSSNNIVNAPTTITKQTSNNLIRTSIRDEDPSIKSYYRSRYAF